MRGGGGGREEKDRKEKVPVGIQLQSFFVTHLLQSSFSMKLFNDKSVIVKTFFFSFLTFCVFCLICLVVQLL